MNTGEAKLGHHRRTFHKVVATVKLFVITFCNYHSSLSTPATCLLKWVFPTIRKDDRSHSAMAIILVHTHISHSGSEFSGFPPPHLPSIAPEWSSASRSQK